MPQAFSESCHKAKVGIGQGVWFFFRSELEVDAATVRLNVREARTLFSFRFAGREQPEFWRPSQPDFPDSNVPLVAHQIEAGFCEAERARSRCVRAAEN